MRGIRGWEKKMRGIRGGENQVEKIGEED